MTELNEKSVELVKKALAELFEKMGFEVEVSPKIIEGEEKEMICFNIQTQNANMLIGQGGGNLQALQHLARVLIRRKAKPIINFTVDVNEYKQGRERYLRGLARDLAIKVDRTKEPVMLKPMTSYERRIIHTTLASEDKIESVSEGEEPERRVVIRPIKGKKRTIEEKIETEIV